MCDPCPGSMSYGGLITVTALLALLASGPAWQCGEGQAVLEPCLLAEAEGWRGVERALGQGATGWRRAILHPAQGASLLPWVAGHSRDDCSLRRDWPATLECDG